MNRLFSALCGIGFSDYLLDIGANIGLTTIQNSSRFSLLFAYEPNPTAFAVLTANCEQIDSKRLHLFPFGIGARDEDNNYYSEDAIAAKETFQQKEETSYGVVQVQIKCGAVTLGEAFKALRKSGQTSGVIKIDTEGYELTILRQIAASKRDGIEFVAVFENWKSSLTEQDVLDIFAGNGFVYKLEWNMGGLNNIQQFMQLAVHGERFSVTDSYHALVGTVIYATRSLL
jgi:FkbM family methyltransferase